MEEAKNRSKKKIMEAKILDPSYGHAKRKSILIQISELNKIQRGNPYKRIPKP